MSQCFRYCLCQQGIRVCLSSNRREVENCPRNKQECSHTGDFHSLGTVFCKVKCILSQRHLTSENSIPDTEKKPITALLFLRFISVEPAIWMPLLLLHHPKSMFAKLTVAKEALTFSMKKCSLQPLISASCCGFKTSLHGVCAAWSSPAATMSLANDY